jgi:hypothetical protein
MPETELNADQARSEERPFFMNPMGGSAMRCACRPDGQPTYNGLKAVRRAVSEGSWPEMNNYENRPTTFINLQHSVGRAAPVAKGTVHCSQYTKN